MNHDLKPRLRDYKPVCENEELGSSPDQKKSFKFNHNCWIREIEWLKVRINLCYSSSICTLNNLFLLTSSPWAFRKVGWPSTWCRPPLVGSSGWKWSPAWPRWPFCPCSSRWCCAAPTTASPPSSQWQFFEAGKEKPRNVKEIFGSGGRALDADFKGWVFKSRKELHFLPFCLPLKLAYKLDIA